MQKRDRHGWQTERINRRRNLGWRGREKGRRKKERRREERIQEMPGLEARQLPGRSNENEIDKRKKCNIL